MDPENEVVIRRAVAAVRTRRPCSFAGGSTRTRRSSTRRRRRRNRSSRRRRSRSTRLLSRGSRRRAVRETVVSISSISSSSSIISSSSSSSSSSSTYLHVHLVEVDVPQCSLVARGRGRVVARAEARAARVAPLGVSHKRVDGREVRGGQRVVVALRGGGRRVAVAGRRHVLASARRLFTTSHKWESTALSQRRCANCVAVRSYACW